MLLDTVWVGTKPRNCILVVLAYCNGGGKQGRKEQTSHKSVRVVIFTNLLSLEVSQSTLIFGYAQLVYNIML